MGHWDSYLKVLRYLFLSTYLSLPFVPFDGENWSSSAGARDVSPWLVDSTGSICRYLPNYTYTIDFRVRGPQPLLSSHIGATPVKGIEPNTSWTALATIAPSISKPVVATAAPAVEHLKTPHGMSLVHLHCSSASQAKQATGTCQP